MSYFYIIPVLGLALGYAYFFYRRGQIKNAGGAEAYAHARLNELFQLTEGERVTAAWAAVTIPKKSTGEKALEVAGVAAAMVAGVGVRIVGRSLGVACTTGNRVLLLDKKDGVVRAYGPISRPRFVATGKKGTKRPSQTRFGWDEGAIVSLEIPGLEAFEIDIMAAAVPVLANWSRGEDVSSLTGPIPVPDSI
jgi:hypothetical protein